LLAACAAELPIAGDWTCPTGSDDWVHELSISEDLGGSALLHYSIAGVTYHSEYGVEGEDRDQGLYWLDFSCREDCPEVGTDFRLTCEYDEDMDQIWCTADGWEDFYWVRAH